MITYEFQCAKGHVTEQRLSIKDETREIDCSYCGKPARRIMSINREPILGLPTNVHHKTGATESGTGPIDLGEIG